MLVGARPVALGNLDDDSALCGDSVTFPAPVVRLHKKLEGYEAATTLFHETLHVISVLYGLGLKEWQVRVLEQTVCGWLRENPQLAQQWVLDILSPAAAAPQWTQSDPKATDVDKCDPKETKGDQGGPVGSGAAFAFKST